jgi:hypothetical protein
VFIALIYNQWHLGVDNVQDLNVDLEQQIVFCLSAVKLLPLANETVFELGRTRHRRNPSEVVKVQLCLGVVIKSDENVSHTLFTIIHEEFDQLLVRLFE